MPYLVILFRCYSDPKEGDPVALIAARTTTFARGKAVFLSSPTQSGASRIEALAADGDLREWHWRCNCGAEHVPQWEHVEWPPGKTDQAVYVMPCCGEVLGDAGRWQAMGRGRWIATQTGQQGIRSYRVRGLSSPWLRLALLASEFDQARGNPGKLSPFYNLRLGLPFEADTGEGADAGAIEALAEDYPGDVVPDGAGLVVAGIDIQGGWVAVLIAAIGEGDELWALQWHEIPGDIKDPATRAAVEQILAQTFRHGSGERLEVEAVAVDSGYETQTVLEWSQRRRAAGKRFYSTKGMPGWRRGIWERGGDQARSLAAHFLVGIDQGKQQVMAGLAMPDDGPGKIHTRRGFAEYAPHWWRWATAEELVTRETSGGAKREWRVKRGERRNEAVDCLVLCLAVAHSNDFRIGQRVERLAKTGRLRDAPTMAALVSRMTGTNAQT